MPLDANIILQGQLPQIENPVDVMSKAMAFRSLANRNQIEGLQAQQEQQKFNDDHAVRQAYANNTTVDPNGTPSINRAGVLSDLAKTAPSLVPQTQQSFAANDMAVQKQKLEQYHNNMEASAQILGGVKDQKSYSQALQQMGQLGINTSQFQPQYDPDSVKLYQYRALSAKDQFAQQLQQQDLGIKQADLGIKQQDSNNKKQELQIERYKAFGGGIPGASGPAGMGGAAGGPAPAQSGATLQGQGAVDPSSLVVQAVPPSHQQKVFDEIGAAQNTAANAPKILGAFDNAASKVHAVDFVPGMANKDQKALHALMGPTFKDVEGTVRQAAMDNMNENTTPQFGDSKATIDTKRNALVGYLQSKSAAPTAKGFGIDLSKYPSTSLDPKLVAGTKDSSSKAQDYALGATAKTKSGVPVVYKGNGVWAPQ